MLDPVAQLQKPFFFFKAAQLLEAVEHFVVGGVADGMHCQTQPTAGCLPADLENFFAVQKTDPPVIRFRGDPRPPKKSFLNQLLYQKNCDAFVVSGEKIKNMLLEAMNFDESRIKVIYAPVDTEKFKPVLDKRSLRKKL